MLPLATKLRVLHEAAMVPANDDRSRLARCHGFAVYDEDGRAGLVRDVKLGESRGDPSALVVRTGLFIRRTVTIPAAEIDEISEQRRRIVLRPQPRSMPTPAGRRHPARQMWLGGT